MVINVFIVNTENMLQLQPNTSKEKVANFILSLDWHRKMGTTQIKSKHSSLSL